MSFFRSRESKGEKKEITQFYGLAPGIDPEAFDHVDIDDKCIGFIAKAIEILAIAGPDASLRFAFVGWIVDDETMLRFRPSISSPPSPPDPNAMDHQEYQVEVKQYEERLARYNELYNELKK